MPSIRLDGAGVSGDRRWCLVDAARRQVLRTVSHPRLMALDVLAEGPDDALVVRGPGGERAEATPRPTGAILTCDYWGRPVELRLCEHPVVDLAARLLDRPPRALALALAPPAAVVYGGGVHLVATATLAALSARLGAPVDPARTRASVVVDAGPEPWIEEGWVGREVALGEARVRVLTATPRCAVLDLEPGSGRRDLPVLRALADCRGNPDGMGPRLGVDGEVSRPGDVRPGDVVVVH
ncbi:MOSC domain-containing protein [Nocardioides acrostichi]|uniref:MOSC domain-containing protein n=1 Tax=Nocardioides acrostichi TaxID=2784339 RepID=A0A930YC80_9ACTN|nr:MOSC domain-containing protein [Nocardioides acrostichi]MBF4161214.1 MOSC domain-containing protein [Nocardioides acrostichi]